MNISAIVSSLYSVMVIPSFRFNTKDEDFNPEGQVKVNVYLRITSVHAAMYKCFDVVSVSIVTLHLTLVLYRQATGMNHTFLG